MVEQSAVNRLVVGSNPTWGVQNPIQEKTFMIRPGKFQLMIVKFY